MGIENDFIYKLINSNNEGVILNNYKQNKLCLDEAGNLLNLSYELLHKAEEKMTDDTPPFQKLLLILTLQAIRLFRSIIILYKSCLDYEALILLRSLLDTTAYIIYISEEDSEERASLYQHSKALSYYNGIKNFSEMAKSYRSKIKENLDFWEEERNRAIQYFKEKYNVDINTDNKSIRNYALRPEKAMEKIRDKGFRYHYLILYPMLSKIAHGDDISSYSFIDIEPNELKLRIDPTTCKKLGFFLSEAMVFILSDLYIINNVFELGKDKSIRNMMKIIQGLDELI